jgi:hypothetical protein
LCLLLFLEPSLLSLGGFFVQQGFDANTTGFRPEVSTQGICAGESATATPVRATLKSASTNELLLTRVQTFVAFAIMLARESFTADRANEWALIRVCPEMRT